MFVSKKNEISRIIINYRQLNNLICQKMTQIEHYIKNRSKIFCKKLRS